MVLARRTVDTMNVSLIFAHELYKANDKDLLRQ
jgi:hypothetical protein